MSERKIAFVTGGAKRVGREICLHLAKQGYNVCVHYSTSETEAAQTAAECEAFGVTAITVQADLTQADACQQAMKACCEQLGTPHLLIHNASVFERDTIENFTEAQLHEHMAVHLYAPLQLVQAWKNSSTSLPDNAQAIMLGDGLEHWSLSDIFLTYTLSKDALRNAVPRLATALAPDIRVNMIACGFTLAGKIDSDEMMERFKTISPLGILSSPEEVCHTINYLVATRSITGQVIALNSGMHLCHNKS